MQFNGPLSQISVLDQIAHRCLEIVQRYSHPPLAAEQSQTCLTELRVLLASQWPDVERMADESCDGYLHSTPRATRLLQSISTAINEAVDFRTALQVVLRQVCETTAWDYGEAWLPDLQQPCLRLEAVWCDRPDLVAFEQASREYIFPADIGLPGRVWVSQQPEWVADVSNQSELLFPRARVAQEVGLKGGFGIPVIANQQVLAVLTFFMVKPQTQQDQEVNSLITTIAAQLGTVIQRKQAEAALYQSEQRFAKAFFSAPAPISITSLEGRYLEVNDSFLTLMEYRREEVVGRTSRDLQTFTDLDQRSQMAAQLLEQGGIRNFERQARTKSGRLIDVLASIEKIELNGDPCFLSMFVDISGPKQMQAFLHQANRNLEARVEARTAELHQINEQLRLEICDRQQVELELARSQQMLQMVLDRIPLALFWKDCQSVYLGCNQVFAELYGLSDPAEVIGLTDFDLPDVTEEQANYYRSCDRQLIEQKRPWIRVQEQRLDRAGKMAWFYWSKYPILDSRGEIMGILVTLENVTDQKLSEEALSQSQQMNALLATAVEHAGDMIEITDAEARFRYVNPAFEAVMGYNRQAVIGRTPRALLRSNQHEEAYYQAIAETLRSGQIWRGQLISRCQDGDLRYLDATISPVCDASGQVTHHVAVKRDVTERKQIEAQIQASLNEKEVMLKEIHHRVKNNLQVVSSLLKLQAGYIKDQEVLNIFLESQNRVRAMALVHEKLYQAEDLAKASFSAYIQSVTANLFRSYAISSQQVQLRLEAEAVRLNLDTAIPCGLIINELVSNSLKYAFPDARSGTITIRFQAQELPAQYLLVVEDNGVGLPDTLDFRNTPSLGLQLVCSLVTQLQGTLSLERGQGTTFKILFNELTSREGM